MKVFSPPDSPLGDTMNSHIKSLPIEKTLISSIWLASDTIPLIDTDHCARGHRVWVDFLVPQFFV